MKKINILYLVCFIGLLFLIFQACVKDLEKEGINTTTKYIGTVVEKSTMKPIEGVSVQVTDGSHVHAFSTTDRNGRFTLNGINFDQVGDDSYLWLDGTALDLPSKQEPLMGLGVEIYDYKALILYDKTNADLLPKVTTDSIDGILALSAKASGKVTADGGHDIVSRGVCFATHQTPTIEDSIATAGAGLGDFTVTMPRLTKATTYFVRAFATNSIGTTYGAQKTFTTQNGGARMTTNAATGIEAKSATVSCRVSDDGGDAITRRGFVYATRQEPTLSDSTTADGSDTGAFSHHLRNLANSTTYYYRPYATNACGTTYGPQKSFTTTSGLPTLTTTDISNITTTSAKGGGNITEDGGFRVTARGLCWNTTGLPDTSDAHITHGSGTGAFSINLTNLSRATTYHVRAYATNSEGIAYGNEVTFSTMDGRAGVTIEAATSITATKAVCSGNVTSDGGLTVTERGLCWNTTGTPKITTDTKVAQGSGTGSFTCSMNNLTPGTTYHVRAYATTSYTTSYSREITFTTNSGYPTVTTSAVSNVRVNDAVCSGNITSDGGFAITDKGFCWSTSQYPTINNNRISAGSGVSSFRSSITGLQRSTIYYVRAYATNSRGTAYGEQKTFTTTDGKPSLTSQRPTTEYFPSSTGSYTYRTANGSTKTGYQEHLRINVVGNIASDQGSSITDRGVCYGTMPYPDTTSSYFHISAGSGSGYFATQIKIFNGSYYADGGAYYSTSPIPITDATLYIRAYATNENGTTYGTQYQLNLKHETLPAFQYSGHTYRVAPSPNNLLIWDDAKNYCENLTLYGHTDWRLPTKDELLQMYSDRSSIGGFTTGVVYTGGASTWQYAYYWSSSVGLQNTNYYTVVLFSNGNLNEFQPYVYTNVRPVRVDN